MESEMKKNLLFLISALILFPIINYGQRANHVVIAEIYGAGGNSGATYKYDYAVLYNPTSSAIDLSAWSIQYQAAASSGSFSLRTNLVGMISPGGYYLIKEAGGTNGAELPTVENVAGTISFSATAGKVALVNDQNYITGISDPNVIDFVGYGSTSNASEGNNPAPAPSTTASICREDNNGNQTYGLNGNGNDSDNNGNDFWVNNSFSPLPVELISFTSRILDKKIELNWQTATEVNNYGFEIQRSTISIPQSASSRNKTTDKWLPIGFVHGNGNSNSPKKYSFTDEPLGNKEFIYRLKQIDFDGSFSFSDELDVVFNSLSSFVLEQNFPNPFNPSTKISYTLPEKVHVKLKVYDILTRQIAELVNSFQETGNYQVTFEGSNLPSGVYFYKFEAGNFVEVKKLLLVK
jgi:hypothetical protein